MFTSRVRSMLARFNPCKHPWGCLVIINASMQKKQCAHELLGWCEKEPCIVWHRRFGKKTTSAVNLLHIGKHTINTHTWLRLDQDQQQKILEENLVSQPWV